MKNASRLVILVAVTLFVFPILSLGGVEFGVSGNSDGVNSFYFAISKHYNVPQEKIESVRRKNISDEELPVVIFFAQQANVSHNDIIKLRIGGKSWFKICRHYDLSPEIFFVELNNPAPPYGKAYGHHKKKNKKDKYSYTDADVVNFINLKFASNYYGYDADEIAGLRGKGHKFADIHNTVKANQKKRQVAAVHDNSKVKKNGKKQGKAKGKSKGKGNSNNAGGVIED